MPSARYKAIAAALLDRITIEEFARLTDRQIFDLYFHPRNEHGGISLSAADLPAKAWEIKPSQVETPTLESDLRDLSILAAAVRMREKDRAEAEAKIRAKYQG